MLGAAHKSSERLPEVARSVIAMRECSEKIRSELHVDPTENPDD
jgi:hypothetical protein